jgi:hypothetical protein
MSDCQVVFYGELQPGQEASAVRQKVAVLFKASDQQIAAFFSGKRVVVKSGLPRQKAEQYLSALANAGAVAHIETSSAAASEGTAVPKQANLKNPSAVADSSAVAASADERPAKQGRVVDAGGQVALSPGDDVGRAVASQVENEKLGQLRAATLAPTGSTLGDPQEQPELDLDLSHMSLCAVGSDLQDSYEQAPAPDIDISHLSLGKTGQ